MISEHIGNWIRGYMIHVGRAIAQLGITPNQLTLIGLLLNVAVAVVIATDHPRLGGVFLLVASAFDMLDGAVARATGKISKFGGFFDSTLDRYSEVVVYLGVLLYLNQTSDAELGAILVVIASSGALMISYARARAESAGYHASVGLVARPERVVLLAICLIIGQPMWALWILAVATHLTALTRIVHVWRLAAREESTTTTPDNTSASTSTKQPRQPASRTNR